MTTPPLYLVDRSSTKIAVLNVEPNGDRYRGAICLDATPPELQRLFEEFEENVEGQMFPLADEVEAKIEASSLRVVFPNGMEASIEDLHVYPSTKRVSFKVRHSTTLDIESAINGLPPRDLPSRNYLNGESVCHDNHERG